MRTLIPTFALVTLFISTAHLNNGAPQMVRPSPSEGACSPYGRPHLRTTLYFGLTHPAGTISESQWRSFLRNDVSTRFPLGLTVWEADGQWRRPDGRISRERAKVLLLVHEDTPEVREALASVVADYKRLFQQQSVLWETSPVCAAF